MEERNPLNQVTTWIYDVAGRRTSSTDAKNQTTRWSHDKVGRVKLSQFADNTSIAYLYDAAGNLTQMSDSLGVTVYGYDALNRDTSVLYGSGHQLTYALDVAGRRVKMNDPDGGQTTYVYDNSDRLTQLTNPQNEITLFSYDALDRVMKKTLANGVIETHTFDAAGRETKVEQRDSSGALLSSFVSVYDRVNQRTSVTEAGGSATTYAYDDDGQLLSETRTGTHPYSIVYSYDEVGNRTNKIEGGLTTTYVYDVANELISQETRDSSHAVVSQGTTTYDANGNVTAQTQDGQTTSFVWNPQNYLMRETAPDGTSESYAYCGEGIRRTVTNASGLRRFIRDGQNILLEADGSGDTIRRYTHMSENWGALISLHEGQSSRYYCFDSSANTRGLINESGSLSDYYIYSAFGEELLVSGVSANPFRFGGEVGYYRDDAERVYVRARHLDVSDGRWLSRDPIGFDGGTWNLYKYVGNSPSNTTDPSGLQGPALLVEIPIGGAALAWIVASAFGLSLYACVRDAACSREIRNAFRDAGRALNPLPIPKPCPKPEIRKKIEPRIKPRGGVRTKKPQPKPTPKPTPIPRPRPTPSTGECTDAEYTALTTWVHAECNKPRSCKEQRGWRYSCPELRRLYGINKECLRRRQYRDRRCSNRDPKPQIHRKERQDVLDAANLCKDKIKRCP